MKTFFRLDVGSLDKPIITRQGYLKADSLPTRAGIFEYAFSDGTTRRELRRPSEVFSKDSLLSLQDIALTNDHPPVPLDIENTGKYQVGHTSGVAEQWNNFIKTKILITQKDAINDIISNGKQELSCGYHCEVLEQPGEWEGQIYDAEQKNIRYNHISIVDAGRAGPEARIKLDSSDAFMIEKKNVGKENDIVPELQNKEDSLNKGDIKMAIKFQIDSVEYELQDSYAPLAKSMTEKLDHAKKLEAELVAAKSEIENLKGKADGMSIELKKKDDEIVAAKNSLPSEKEMSKLVKGRTDVMAVAATVLGAEFNCDELDTIEIKKAILQKTSPESKFDGKSSEYIDGVYDALNKTSKLDSTSQVETEIGNVVTDTANPEAKTDRKNVIDFYKNAHKSGQKTA
jgi:hypothetical protein